METELIVVNLITVLYAFFSILAIMKSATMSETSGGSKTRRNKNFKK